MMNLTAAITNLSSEIGALRQARETFMENLRKETRDRRTAVSEMRANLAFLRSRMASRTRSDLSAFVSNLKHRVGRLRDEVRTDMAGAHRALFGSARGFGEQPSAEVAFRSERKKSRQRSE